VRAAGAVFALLVAGLSVSGAPTDGKSKELIYVDPAGVMRWRTSDVEVAMLGANYCLPSASDYRAAAAVGADKKRLIEQDMTHFARMGWDALRLSFWGDWENCDREGNLVANDHLDLLDYLIFQAKRRDLHMLLSPIVTYSSMWPDGDDPAAQGFSRYFKKEELGTNPRAIAAQANYLRQLLNHVNPYTKLALKDEPYICFIELINEPTHHPQDFDGSVAYINALHDAVRSTGCQKITFFNFSEEFAMAQALAASKVDGVSFAWYPSGLVSGHQLRGNFLRTVDAYAPMLAPELLGRPRLVYEYDMPDVMSGYHYPAMVRTFRSVGAQSAAMFAYDMLATAPYNLGWQTHCLNMVYTPQKAASAIIASQVMRRIPRMTPVDPYPANTRFGDFRVSYEENLSELVSNDLFYYSNTTGSRPPHPERLKRIVGFGSSPVVDYEGVGLYFLDKLETGVWRLEVYPDSLQIDDPFARPSRDRLVFRLISREWPMHIRLPDLGQSFTVRPLDSGNTFSSRARDGVTPIVPGAYLLVSGSRPGPGTLPDRLPGVPYSYGLREFVCPPPLSFPTTLVLHAQPEYPAGEPVTIRATVASDDAPDRVVLSVADHGRDLEQVPMARTRGYDYEAMFPEGSVRPGPLSFTIRVEAKGKSTVFPAESPVASLRAEAYSTRVVGRHDPVALFVPASDAPFLAVSRSGGAANLITATHDGGGSTRAYPLGFPEGPMPEDLTISLYIGDRVADRGPLIAGAKTLNVRLKALRAPSVIRVTLVEADGSAWSAKVFASTEWRTAEIPIGALRPASAVMLPQGYPNTWSYWLRPPEGAKAPKLEHVERLQLSLRRADFGALSPVDSSQAAVAIESAALAF
jgi:hypothetical protein